MDCKEFSEKLDSYVHNELTEQESAEMKEHIDKCKECREQAEFAHGIANALKNLPPIEVPEDFKTTLYAKIKADKRKRFYISWKSYAALAACIVLFVVLRTGVMDMMDTLYAPEETPLPTMSAVQETIMPEQAEPKPLGQPESKQPEQTGKAEHMTEDATEYTSVSKPFAQIETREKATKPTSTQAPAKTAPSVSKPPESKPDVYEDSNAILPQPTQAPAPAAENTSPTEQQAVQPLSEDGGDLARAAAPEPALGEQPKAAVFTLKNMLPESLKESETDAQGFSAAEDTASVILREGYSGNSGGSGGRSNAASTAGVQQETQTITADKAHRQLITDLLNEYSVSCRDGVYTVTCEQMRIVANILDEKQIKYEVSFVLDECSDTIEIMICDF